MSVWQSENVGDKVLEVLESVPHSSGTHHFGRPYVTAYQLAIGLDQTHPEIRQALNYPLGGEGVGQQYSLVQYLAKQLSDQIRDDPAYPVEGAFLSNESVQNLAFAAADGSVLTSSLTNTGVDLSLFRVKDGGATL
jgi:hypothetical protein